MTVVRTLEIREDEDGTLSVNSYQSPVTARNLEASYTDKIALLERATQFIQVAAEHASKA